MRGSHVLLAALAAAVALTSVAAGGGPAEPIQHYPEVSDAVWSPDGQRIAFLASPSTGPGIFDIRVVSAEGSGQRGRVLVRDAGSLAWSPDGRRIAFDRANTIYVVNADGSGQRRLTREAETSFWAPVWSPDGRRIALSGWRVGETGHNPYIYVVGADGSALRTLTRRGSGPAWSPDGRKIAFTSVPAAKNVYTPNHVFSMNADGSGKRKLARGYGPVWSPDGEKIAFGAGSTDVTDVYVMNADGSGKRNLTRSPANEGSLAWSPDGQKLLFVSDRDGLEAAYVMNADGSGQRKLTSPGPAIPFAVRCEFSHRTQDDPIVFPREPGRSHDHTFFGNRSTDAFATSTALRKDKRTTCNERDDASAYWVPTLYVAGRAVEPLALVATYSRRTSRPLEPFPVGLKMIAGNANARGAQNSRVTFWSCAIPPAERSSTIPRCPGTRRGGLRLHVSFPDCWDGTRLDSADHQSHMAYSSQAACPRSHPVAVPALSLVVHYPVSGRRSAELASGGQFSGHADFLNAWNQAGLASRVKRYLNRTRE